MSIEIDLEEDIEKAVCDYMDEHLENAINKAISDRDTVLNLISRVEELEEINRLAVIPPEVQPQLRSEAPVVEEVRPEGELKPVSAYGTYRVVEDEGYGMFLARQNPEWEVLHLFSVQFPSFPTRYVLAEDAHRAIRQASCGLGYEGGVAPELEVQAVVTRLSLMLRGWSDREF